MLGSLVVTETFVILAEEHGPQVLIMFVIIHVFKTFGLNSLCKLLLLCSNLCWIQEVLLLFYLFLWQKASCLLHLDEPFVSTLQIKLLVGFVIC